MMHLHTLKDGNFKAKKVIVRVDFNVPMENGRIADDTKIKASLPTIKYLLGHQAAQIILLSHLGQPKGKHPEFSLAPVAKYLASLLPDVGFAPEPFNSFPKNKIVLCENVRFFPEETSKDDEVRLQHAKKLASLAPGGLFVNDAFASSHRKHASVYDLATMLPAEAGKSIEEELAKQEINLKEAVKEL